MTYYPFPHPPFHWKPSVKSEQNTPASVTDGQTYRIFVVAKSLHRLLFPLHDIALL